MPMASTQSIISEAHLQEPKAQEKPNPDDFSSLEISDLEAGPVAGKPELENDINKINWDSDDDPSNPKNWNASRKWQNLGVISVMSLTT